ncbi:MAG: circularly permuted type 2 ATP-grasp protein [Solirubrobacterales bacterium]|nr:circularly permuted type 2 ATP-grasp protein [Solirubrobacterales bacterium]
MNETTAELVEAYDEAFADDGHPRSHYAALLLELAAADLGALREQVSRELADVVFTGPGGDTAFEVDPVPRILPAAEWERLAAGLEQRVRALNAFILDAYGPRRCVADGVVPAHVLDEAEGAEGDLLGRHPGGVPVGIAGLDVVRDPEGELLVLEDNLRTPSGFAYAAAARRAVRGALPRLGEPVAFDGVWELLRATLHGATEAQDPLVVVLSDGPSNSAYWEHRRVAEHLGIPLVTLGDVAHRGDRLVLRDGSRPVDVVYRRSDQDLLRDEDGRPTAVGEALRGPWLAGTLGVVNGFGNGIGDDKLVHAYVEELVRYFCGEEPLLRSVPTLDLGRPGALEQVLDDLRCWVVKPRLGYGGQGVVVCSHADDAALRRVAADLREAPSGYVAQRTVPLSRHPTVIDGKLEPRHVDLRPFIFSTPGGVRALPGGLTRVAWDRGALVVNSSQNGGAKDTWVCT